ncbi:alkylhydroperoxidase domain protein [Miniimonas sp. S16]|uniref:alkylhydroperoxidase domain protein n=1 Tax=Miniimonas sp. S16 TaxID=2171623 RepID=UPI000D529180|nr:alkylhydroperoxidase domain protein [Miniimonas sp. S16]
MTATATSGTDATEGAQRGRGVDLVDAVVGIAPGSRLDALRRGRDVARTHTQASHDALFAPVAENGFPLVERYAVASLVLALHGAAAAPLGAAYDGELAARDAALAAEVAAIAEAARRPGPYGVYREPGLAGESEPGEAFTVASSAVVPPRLASGLTHAVLLVLRPRESSPQALQALLDAGWTTSQIVTLSQLVAFLAYQVRLVHGLGVLAGSSDAAVGVSVGSAGADTSATDASGAGAGGAATSGAAEAGAFGVEVEPVVDPGDRAVTTYPDLDRPDHFTRANLGWVPWLTPPAADQLSERQYAGLVERNRDASPYFRLLALDPEVLAARTRTDLDIFRTGAPRKPSDGEGLPRPERELSAAVASRVNGCVFCASVHARFAEQLSHRTDEVDLLLRKGTEAATAQLEPRWAAVVRAAAALSRTPSAFDAEHVAELRGVGLSDEAILDVVGAAGFFAWANRLMLSLGEPENPA